MFLAHLDLARAMERAVRRARVPVALTQGFNPHPRLAFAAPLPVGVTGRREVLEIWLDEVIGAGELADRLNSSLPAGLQVLRAREVAAGAPSLMSMVDGAWYAMTLETGDGAARWEQLAQEGTLERRLADLMAFDRIELAKSTPGKPDRLVDARPLIIDLRCQPGPGLTALVRIGGRGNLRPRELLNVVGRVLDGHVPGPLWSVERLETGRLGQQELIPAWEL